MSIVYERVDIVLIVVDIVHENMRLMMDPGIRFLVVHPHWLEQSAVL